MHVTTDANRASLMLEPGEHFFFKKSMLQGQAQFDWCLRPPYPFGSPIARMLCGSYFWMKKIAARDKQMTIELAGIFARGSFHSIVIPSGEKFFINPHLLAGFSGGFKSVHTHIKVAPVYFCVRKHFFPVFEGPGTVIFYSVSPIQESEELHFQPERLVAFNIARQFTAITPQPSTIASQVYNVFSHELIWRFLVPGTTVAESRSHHESAQGGDSHRFRQLVKHLLGFLRI